MALADLRQGYKNSAWFTSNPTLVLKQGQVVHLLQTGQYKLGDGTTQLSALSFLGGAVFSGTTLQYVRGDGSLATFPTLVSAFTNDAGYITSSALSPYLTSALAASTYQPLLGFTAEDVANKAINFATLNNTLYPTTQAVSNYVTGLGYITSSALSPYLLASTAASTYQPIGSYLTANQTITLSGVVTGSGSTAITTAFASTTGSGAVVLATSPTIQTLLSVNGQALVTDGTATTRIGAYGANQSAIWFNQTTPTTANYALYGSATQTFFNATSLIGLAINDSSTITINSSAMNVINGKNITFGTSTGTRIGTATNQLFAFWNATPVSRPAAVTTVQGLYDALSSIGLIASGTISASSLISGTANVNFVNETVKEITINTTSVLTTSYILITFAMSSTKDMDELDFYKPFVTYGKIVNGTSFNVRVCLDAPTTNNFKIDYQIIN
jgi:hypothetical protein